MSVSSAIKSSGSVLTQRVIVVVSAMAAVVAMVLVALVPGVSTLVKGKEVLSSRQVAVVQLASKAEFLESLDLSQLANQLTTSLAALPHTLPYQQTLRLLSVMASRHSLGVEELRFSTETAAGTSVIGVRLAVRATYLELSDFLKDLQRSLPLVSLRSVELSVIQTGPRTGEGAAVYRATLFFTVASSPSPSTIGKPSDSLPVVNQELDQVLRTIQGFESPVATASSETPAEALPRLFPE